MNSNDTTILRAIRRELCQMEPGDEKTIWAMRVRRENPTLAFTFDLISSGLPPQCLDGAEGLIFDARHAHKAQREMAKK